MRAAVLAALLLLGGPCLAAEPKIKQKVLEENVYDVCAMYYPSDKDGKVKVRGRSLPKPR